MARTRRGNRNPNNGRQWKGKTPYRSKTKIDLKRTNLKACKNTDSGDIFAGEDSNGVKETIQQDYEKRIERLKNDVNASVRKLYTNHINVSKKNGELSTLQTRIQELVSELENEHKRSTHHASNLENVRQENSDALKKVKQFEVQLEQSQKLYADMREKAKQFRQDKKKLETEIKKIATKHKLTEDELKEKSKKLKTDFEEKIQILKMKDSVLGHVGIRPKPLHNIGSTCFMNAMLQTLAWTPQLGHELQKQLTVMHGIITSDAYDMTLSVSNLLCYTHIDNMAHSSSSVPKGIRQAVRRKNALFNGNQQQDSFELFNTIVNGLKDEVLSFYTELVVDNKGQKKDKNILGRYGAVRLFNGEFITVYRYSSCNHVESVFQSFTSISVPMMKKNIQQKYPNALNDNKNDRGNSKDTQEESKLNESFPFELKPSQFYRDCCSDPKCKNDKKCIEFSDNNSTKKSECSAEDDIFFDAQQILHSPSTKSVDTQVYEADFADIIITQKDHLRGASSQDNNHPFETLEWNASHSTDIEYGLSHGLMKVETFGEDTLPCRKCPKPSTSGTCFKKTLILEPPDILVLHIDRFKENNRRGLVKRNDMVTYPETLDIGQFCSIAFKVYQKDINSRLSYSLYGIVAHSGTMNSGHYTAYIKTTGRSSTLWYDEIIGKYFDAPQKRKTDIESFLEGHQMLQGDTSTDDSASWFYVSDEFVQECRVEDAINNPDAYVLLYERL